SEAAARYAGPRQAHAVIADRQPHAACVHPEFDLDDAGAGMLQRVLHGLLGDAVEVIARVEIKSYLTFQTRTEQHQGVAERAAAGQSPQRAPQSHAASAP